MKDVLSYCKKIIESTNESTKNTETTLRNLTGNQEFLNIEKILKTNVEATKCQMHQWKFKKFNYRKYKPQPIKEQTPAITQANSKKSYANDIKENTDIIDRKTQHLRKNSKINFQGKAGITTSSSYTTPLQEITNKSPFHIKANINQ